MPRLSLRVFALAALSLVLATQAEAQRSRRPRKKPFAAFSESAERLKDSLSVRLGRPVEPMVLDSATATPGPFAAATAVDTLVQAARSQLGTRYVLGAERPGKAFDCSGLVRFVMSALRIDLPRTAHEQATRGATVAKDVSQLRPGDLLTFGRGSRVSHIAVYVGDGRFVHASTSKRRVVEASIETEGTWFRRNWLGVRRLLALAPGDSTAEQ